MPLYEYQCRKCGHRFERIQQFSDAPVKKCPECGGAVEKLLSAPAVQFKGSGFYATDYPRSGGGAAKSDESPGKNDSAGGKGESSDGVGAKAAESGEKHGKTKPATKKTESKK